MLKTWYAKSMEKPCNCGTNYIKKYYIYYIILYINSIGYIQQPKTTVKCKNQISNIALIGSCSCDVVSGFFTVDRGKLSGAFVFHGN
jgi:hypothetical protein